MSMVSPTGLIVRAMIRRDWPAVVKIYAEGIATGNATVEREPSAWAGWDAGHRRDCRLVATIEDRVVGWAALTPYSGRKVYAGVAWESVYVAADRRGQGVGSALLAAIVPATEAAGVWTLLAGVLVENVASLTLHERAGFRRIGVQERIGRDRTGRWRDVVLLERRSPIVGRDDRAVRPKPPRSP
jgi:phosphinothricin acetyltransferase